MITERQFHTWSRSNCDHLVVRTDSSKVALSFALVNPEVADGGMPQVGNFVDQVTETELAPTQYTDESGGSPEPSHEIPHVMREISTKARRVRNRRRRAFHYLFWRTKNPCAKKKAENRITDDMKMHVRCTRDTMNPMVNTIQLQF